MEVLRTKIINLPKAKRFKKGLRLEFKKTL